MRTLAAFVAIGLVPCSMTQLDPRAAEPPRARKDPVATTLHGDTRVDEFRWLQDKTSQEVLDYLSTENAYQQAVMRPTVELQTKLYEEIVGRIQETDLEVPVFDNGYWYYSRTEQGKEYSIYCRRRTSMDAPEQILLDLNEIAKDHAYVGLGAFSVSDNGHLLAFSIDTTGFREFELYIKDLRTNQLLSDRLGKVSQVAWASDNQTLFYVTEDEAKRWNKLWRYRLGSGEAPVEIYEETDRLYWFYISRTRDRRFLLLYSASSETTEVQFLPSDQPTAGPRIIAPRREDEKYSVDHRHGLFYILTNDRGPNYRLVVAPVGTPGREHWRQILAHRDDVVLDGVSLFERHMVLSQRREGFSRLMVTDFRNYTSRLIRSPEAVATFSLGANPQFASNTVRYQFTSYQTPNSVMEYNVLSGESQLLKRQPVLGDFKPEDYVTELFWATAEDGVRIPITLVRHRATSLSPETPLLLNGYGAYGVPSDPGFSISRLSLLNRGVVYAVAHVRGGGEFGERWHDGGKMVDKMKTFTDFIACADYLVTEGKTSRNRLAIQGGSAGGLLVGAVMNLRPDLCMAVIADVPFVDVLNTMLDDSLPLTTGEWLEWGNPNVAEQYNWIRQYCPYTNVGAHRYPHLLVNTSLNDSQVMYWEPAKWVARLRDRSTGENLILLKTNMDAGHGGASGRYEAIREVAYDYAFLLWLWGIRE